MGSDEDRAYEIFYDLIAEGEGAEYGLEKRHLNRGVTIERESETRFLISIKRHPHLFGRQSVGRPSSAFATVKQAFSVDLETRKLDFIDEELENWHIDYKALAEEDIFSELGGFDMLLSKEDEDKLATLASEAEVQSLADEIFPRHDFEHMYEYLYVPDSGVELPPDFREKLLEAQQKVWSEELVELWRSKQDKTDHIHAG